MNIIIPIAISVIVSFVMTHSSYCKRIAEGKRKEEVKQILEKHSEL